MWVTPTIGLYPGWNIKEKGAGDLAQWRTCLSGKLKVMNSFDPWYQKKRKRNQKTHWHPFILKMCSKTPRGCPLDSTESNIAYTALCFSYIHGSMMNLQLFTKGGPFILFHISEFPEYHSHTLDPLLSNISIVSTQHYYNSQSGNSERDTE